MGHSLRYSMKRYAISDFKNHAKIKYGFCHSSKYKNIHEKLKWECKLGHKWSATGASVLRGSWCQKCANRKLSETKISSLQVCQERAIKKGFKLLSEVYSGSGVKLDWMCSAGHIWSAIPSSVLNRTGCPVCAGTTLDTIENMQIIAECKGGKCISTKYKNAHTKLLWECGNKHQWMAKPDAVKRSTWCPECSSGLGERICREYFEQIFSADFSRCRPSWLKNEDGVLLELDGYNERLKIAFEHQCQYHYNLKGYFSASPKELKERKRIDRLKLRLCTKNGVRVFQIKEIPKDQSVENLKFEIESQAKKLKIKFPKNFGSMNFDLKNAYSPNMIKAINKYIETKGGVCLSKNYLGARTGLQFKCKLGHIWTAAPYHIYNGTWCKKCYHLNRRESKKPTLKDFQFFAAKKNGICMTATANSWRDLVAWQCEVGHIWESRALNIRRGKWCPKCAIRKNANKLR